MIDLKEFNSLSRCGISPYRQIKIERMLLPSATIRGALKLKDPAQRLVWGLSQLSAGIYKTPATTAVPALNIKTDNATAGMQIPVTPTKPVDPTMRWDGFAGSLGLDATLWTRNALNFGQVWMPLDPSLIAQGLDFGVCVATLTADTVRPLATTPVAGSAILDNSTAITIEQYIVEQYRLLMADAAIAFDDLSPADKSIFKLGLDVDNPIPSDFQSYYQVDCADYVKQHLPVLVLDTFSIPAIPVEKTSGVATAWETDTNYSVNPYNYCSYTNYVAALAALT